MERENLLIKQQHTLSFLGGGITVKSGRYLFGFSALVLSLSSPALASPSAEEKSQRPASEMSYTLQPARDSLPPTRERKWSANDFRYEPLPAVAAQWSPTETKGFAQAKAALRWEVSYLALSAIDTVQTVSCLQRGECEEANPLFGKHPKPTKLIAAKLVFGAAHFALFNRLNKRNPHAAMRYAQGSVILQGGVVLLNARFGFR